MIAAALDRHVDLKLAKKVFMALSAVILFILPADLLFVYFSKPMSGQLQAQTYASLQPSELYPLEAYEPSFQTGGLFGGVVTSSGLTVLKASIHELIKDYRLKGVVILSEPEAIVEDARTQKSIFVKAGQTLGELTVKEVTEGRIVLTCYGEEAEMKIE